MSVGRSDSTSPNQKVQHEQSEKTSPSSSQTGSLNNRTVIEKKLKASQEPNVDVLLTRLSRFIELTNNPKEMQKMKLEIKELISANFEKILNTNSVKKLYNRTFLGRGTTSTRIGTKLTVKGKALQAFEQLTKEIKTEKEKLQAEKEKLQAEIHHERTSATLKTISAFHSKEMGEAEVLGLLKQMGKLPAELRDICMESLINNQFHFGIVDKLPKVQRSHYGPQIENARKNLEEASKATYDWAHETISKQGSSPMSPSVVEEIIRQTNRLPRPLKDACIKKLLKSQIHFNIQSNLPEPILKEYQGEINRILSRIANNINRSITRRRSSELDQKSVDEILEQVEILPEDLRRDSIETMIISQYSFGIQEKLPESVGKEYQQELSRARSESEISEKYNSILDIISKNDGRIDSKELNDLFDRIKDLPHDRKISCEKKLIINQMKFGFEGRLSKPNAEAFQKRIGQIIDTEKGAITRSISRQSSREMSQSGVDRILVKINSLPQESREECIVELIKSQIAFGIEEKLPPPLPNDFQELISSEKKNLEAEEAKSKVEKTNRENSSQLQKEIREKGSKKIGREGLNKIFKQILELPAELANRNLRLLIQKQLKFGIANKFTPEIMKAYPEQISFAREELATSNRIHFLNDIIQKHEGHEMNTETLNLIFDEINQLPQSQKNKFADRVITQQLQLGLKEKLSPSNIKEHAQNISKAETAHSKNIIKAILEKGSGEMDQKSIDEFIKMAECLPAELRGGCLEELIFSQISHGIQEKLPAGISKEYQPKFAAITKNLKTKQEVEKNLSTIKDRSRQSFEQLGKLMNTKDINQITTSDIFREGYDTVWNASVHFSATVEHSPENLTFFQLGTLLLKDEPLTAFEISKLNDCEAIILNDIINGSDHINGAPVNWTLINDIKRCFNGLRNNREGAKEQFADIMLRVFIREDSAIQANLASAERLEIENNYTKKLGNTEAFKKALAGGLTAISQMMTNDVTRRFLTAVQAGS